MFDKPWSLALTFVGDTVYLIGAGLNRVIMENFRKVSPPLIGEFFTVAARLEIFTKWDQTGLTEVFEYVEKYWHRDRTDLASKPFDIEECITFIESQIQEADRDKNAEALKNLVTIRSKLRGLILSVLSQFSAHATMSMELLTFGKLIWRQKPTIITFNYDTFLEQGIEQASGFNNDSVQLVAEYESRDPSKPLQASDKLLSYHSYNWNPKLAYGIKFDEVDLHIFGNEPVSGKDFYDYSENQLYTWPILKLHGSINWFRYLPESILDDYVRKQIGRENESPREGFVLMNNPFSKVDDSFPTRGSWYLDPIIVPPTLFKHETFGITDYGKILYPLWKMARNALSTCKKLIVIGYSFPPTDFEIKRVFREAFSENDLEELIVVDPNCDVAPRIKELTRFQGQVTPYKNLRDFLLARCHDSDLTLL